MKKNPGRSAVTSPTFSGYRSYLPCLADVVVYHLCFLTCSTTRIFLIRMLKLYQIISEIWNLIHLLFYQTPSTNSYWLPVRNKQPLVFPDLIRRSTHHQTSAVQTA